MRFFLDVKQNNIDQLQWPCKPYLKGRTFTVLLVLQFPFVFLLIINKRSQYIDGVFSFTASMHIPVHDTVSSIIDDSRYPLQCSCNYPTLHADGSSSCFRFEDDDDDHLHGLCIEKGKSELIARIRDDVHV